MATRTRSTPPAHAFASTRQRFTTASGREGQYFSLPVLAQTYPNIKRLPVSKTDEAALLEQLHSGLTQMMKAAEKGKGGIASSLLEVRAGVRS